MHATLDPIAAVIRVHDEDEDTYTWACTVTIDRAAREAHLFGALRLPSIEEARAVKEALKRAGITKASWERRTGRVRSTSVSTRERGGG